MPLQLFTRRLRGTDIVTDGQPTMEEICSMADRLAESHDYLLGRVEDPEETAVPEADAEPRSVQLPTRMSSIPRLWPTPSQETQVPYWKAEVA
jgi:hypothetical protein